MSFDIQDWKKRICDTDVIFDYEGNISGDLITKILEEVEATLENSKEISKIKKRLYNVIVEALQNLFHHVDDSPKEVEKILGKKYVVFVIKQLDSSYKMVSMNFILSSKIQILKDRIDQINLLSVEELKVLYKLILNNQEFSMKGGGGLGLIDIARRTGKKIEYNFYQFNEDYCIFQMDVNI